VRRFRPGELNALAKRLKRENRKLDKKLGLLKPSPSKGLGGMADSCPLDVAAKEKK
jgi:hypothetical protein